MSPLLVLKISGRPPDLHQQGMNRWYRASLIRVRRSTVKVLAQGERHRARMMPATTKRRLHIEVWWRGPKRDSPNLLQDLKADIDGLADAGWIVNDNDKWLQLDYPPVYHYAVTTRQLAIEYRLYEAIDHDPGLGQFHYEALK